jgi:hypothetical protein
MLTSAVKRYILPFSKEKSREPFGSEVEAAAVFAIAELERNKGGGLIVKQPEEKLLFIAKVGYPLWLFPKNESTFIFDGLNDSSYSVSYVEMPTAKAFMENLERNSKPRENYMSFLSDHDNYFQQPMKEKEFTLRGLIADLDFKSEFNVYRKEAMEVTGQLANSALLSPTLEETTVSSMITELDKLQSFLKEDAEKLPECIRLVNKTTSQYITELDYEAEAVKEEADAKIRAQEEFVNPQVAKLNSEYKNRIKDLTENFDKELESFEKLKIKTEKFIESNEEKIKQYQNEAKTQASKNHLIYEKRWKEKSKQTKKELDGLKKELGKIEKNIKNVSKRKKLETSKLQFEAKIKLARQPLLELEAARDAKMLAFKRETEKLIKQEKPVIEGLAKNIKLQETITAKFEMLGIRDQQLKSPALIYVPFYVACYQTGPTERYLIRPPSIISAIDFSAKLKGALGMSKIKDLLIPRFKAITALIDKVQVLTKQNTILENRLRDLCEKNNLVKTILFRENIEKGFVFLKHEGWLSDKEHQVLSNRLTYT